LQLDRRGDVLVSIGGSGASSLAHVAQPLRRAGLWWGAVDSHRGTALHLGVPAVLSEGRVASVGSTPQGEDKAIRLSDLRSGATRTLVGFSGVAEVAGLALSGNELAWSQESTMIERTDAGCSSVALAPPQLVRVDLRALPIAPVTITGPSAPPPRGRECVVHNAP
jgi:hypothetical protein